MGPMPVLTSLFATAMAVSVPVFVLIVLLRRRITPKFGSALVAASFSLSTAYRLYRMEWFDVWRFGSPPVGYLVNYVPWIAGMGLAGWLIASALLRRLRRGALTS